MSGVSARVSTSRLVAPRGHRERHPRGRVRVRWLVLSLLLAGAGLLVPPAADAQDADGPTVLVVVDASGSMARSDDDGNDLMTDTRTAVDALLDRLPDGSRVGVRAYGHRVGSEEELRDEGCVDTELLAPVGATDDQVRAALDGLQPSGWTALGSALEAVAGDLDGVDDATVVVISDGEDNCLAPDPCDAATPLAVESPGLVVDTIGLVLDTDVAARQLRCIAAASGGRFATAQDGATLSDVIRRSAVSAIRRHRNRPAASTPSATPSPVDQVLPTRGRPRAIEGTDQPEDAPVLEAGRDHHQHVEGATVLHYQLGDVGPGDHLDVQVDRTPSRPRDTEYVTFWADVIDADGRWVSALWPWPHGPEVSARLTASVAVLDPPAPYLLRVEVVEVGDGDPPPQDLVIRLQHDPAEVDPVADVAATDPSATAAEPIQGLEAPAQSGTVVLAGVVLLVLVALGILAVGLARRWQRRGPSAP